jgi:hypothetical protein
MKREDGKGIVMARDACTLLATNSAAERCNSGSARVTAFRISALDCPKAVDVISANSNKTRMPRYDVTRWNPRTPKTR